MIILKSRQEIATMRRAGRIVAEVLQELRRAAVPGVTTEALDRLAEAGIRARAGQTAFKGYRGFPSTLCASVNEQVVHGIPGDRVLKAGDIIGLDLGARVDGYFADAAITVPVGQVHERAQRLMAITEQALNAGIAQLQVGHRLSDVSSAIQHLVEAKGYSVVRQFVGHGIGAQIHEDPPVPNFGPAHWGPRLKAGMVLAIEPMVNIGAPEVEILEDGWTVVTKDGSLSAHFEHTVAITEQGPQILTMVDGH
ncbi:MAG: type I methionyl aminopeptidase [Candidatus Omnitrophica bacterium]|nr:type I methionyl aminopeptidase [Candidatus Omnitrophota bacterium]